MPCTASHHGAIDLDLGGVACGSHLGRFTLPPHAHRRPMFSLANAFSAEELAAVGVTGPLDLFHILEALGIGQ